MINRIVCLSLLLFCSFSISFADDKPAIANGGFETGEVGKAPAEWLFPDVCKKAGYSLAISDDKPFQGKQCAILSRNAKTPSEMFGNLLQSIDATPFRGKRVRFKAAVRAEVKGEGNQAQLWFRVDCPNEGDGFFDNMGDRPITKDKWTHYEIVGDVSKDAGSIALGMLMLGHGKVAIDDVTLEIVDASVKVTGPAKLIPPAPGVMEVRMAATIKAAPKVTEATYLYPLPLNYRDQTPLSFHLNVEPADCAKAVEIVEGPGPNRILKLTLTNIGQHEIKVDYQSLMLVRPTEFKSIPKSAEYPKAWPDESKPWLQSTWCCEHENERIAKLANEIRGESNDVIAVIRKALAISQTTFSNAKGRVNNLTAVEALDKSGSCTSCANLVAALIRGTGIPARVLAGYPLWSGPLQTHYIVEAYVPGYGWMPVESTMGKMPWPNHQQVNVSIIPIEHESEAKAKQRGNVAGAVPYLSLSELADPSVMIFSLGTLGKYCDHECRMVRPIEAKRDEWTKSFAWAEPRWNAWLKSKPALTKGKLTFGKQSSEVNATSLDELFKQINPTPQ